MINAAAEQMFGITKQAAVGALLAETIIPPSLRGAHRQGLEQFLATGDGPLIGKRMEVPAVRADGSEFPIEVSIIQVPGSEPPMFTGFLRDLTERKRAEQQREQLLERERLAREDSERANRMKDEFLANLSHELRTPLQSMLGWVHILRQGAADAPTAAHALATIERNARAQKQLIEDLLDMSGIISGKLQLDVQRVDLVPIIEAALVTARPAADAKQIRLERVLDPAAGAVLGDPNRLQQVLWNLLSNAIKFTPAKGRVTVVLERAGTQLRMIVSDTGEGIRRDFLPYVFDRFRQADASLTRRHGGLGLGLSIVRHLVELHGGTVEASSAGEGQGATFTLMLPSAPSTAREVLVNGPMRRAASSLERLKILLVDDEPDSRALIQHLLEQHGARVAVAGSGPDALAALERDPPDVLVSDLAMPHMDGYELIKRVRARPASRGGNTPAASLTAFARAEDRERAMRAGYQAHITKPVDAAELIAVIATLAGQSGSRPSTLVER
ncbi:MAG: ATP-binding protein [Planctomycetota bacterium]